MNLPRLPGSVYPKRIYSCSCSSRVIAVYESLLRHLPFAGMRGGDPFRDGLSIQSGPNLCRIQVKCSAQLPGGV
jgi:hypothetical protein